MSLIERALRNKMILAWHKSLPLISSQPSKAITKSSIVVEYSRFLGDCPLSEIVFDMTGEDDLDFLWATHQKEIENYNKKA